MVLFSTCSGSNPAQKDGDEWVQHKDPLGFVVRHPRGWVVESAEGGRITVRSADKSVFAVIQPFFLRQGITSEEWTGKVPTLFAALFPKARIGKLQQCRQKPDETVALLTYDIEGKPGQATVLCSIYGSSGMFYAIAAPKEQFPQKKKTLVHVLETFKFTEPSAPPKGSGADADIKYVRWKDPKENAFSLEVPGGWKVSGGMFRFAAVDVRPSLAVVSPDEKIRFTGGDAEIPTFSIPTPLMQSLGFTEGAPYSPGYGVQMIVGRFRPGVEFAKEYVQKKVAKGYSDLTFIEARDRPEVAEAINKIYAPYAAQYGGIVPRFSTGEVAFTCRSGDQPMRGYYFAGTMLVLLGTDMSAGGIWNVQILYGYVTAADKVKQAQAILDRMLRSYRFNPEWVAMQQGITGETSRIVSRTHAEISKIIDETYWTRQHSQDELRRKWSNMILGQTDVIDPETGETWKVASGHNYYWRKEGTDTIAGTETYDRPDIDFTPLQEW